MKLLAEHLDDIIAKIYTVTIGVIVGIFAVFIFLVFLKDVYAPLVIGRPENFVILTGSALTTLLALLAPFFRGMILQRRLTDSGFYTKYKFASYNFATAVAFALRVLPAIFGAYLSVRSGEITWYIGLGGFSAIVIFITIPKREELTKLFPGSYL
jgi:hypothetical protein